MIDQPTLMFWLLGMLPLWLAVGVCLADGLIARCRPEAEEVLRYYCVVQPTWVIWGIGAMVGAAVLTPVSRGVPVIEAAVDMAPFIVGWVLGVLLLTLRMRRRAAAR